MTLKRLPILVLGALTIAANPLCASSQESLFERDVLPILTKQCLGCHGGLRQKGGLDMRTMPLLLKGGKHGPAAKAGDADASLLWQRIASDEMPPGETKLSASEKQLIKQWITKGLPTDAQKAKDDDPLLTPGVTHAPKEVAAAIDKHIDKRLAALKLNAAPRSDDVEFLRRVTLDLMVASPMLWKQRPFWIAKRPTSAPSSSRSCSPVRVSATNSDAPGVNGFVLPNCQAT